MEITIRTEASSLIGSGHVMRCLTIATNLIRLGHHVKFWMEPLPGDLIKWVESHGFLVISEIQYVDILIVDHYQLDARWEQAMRPYADKIVVIDDLANRQHDCDLLLDQNVIENYQHRYDDLVPPHCKKLLGPQYLIMRDEFIEARKKRIIRSGNVSRLLLFMGGSDPTNETMKALHALQRTRSYFEHIDVVVGSSNPKRAEIEHICHERQYVFHCQVDYMATLMNAADFSLGAGGATTWERCYVGLPSTSTIVADNQVGSTQTAEQLGAVINLGWHEKVTIDTYTKLLDSLPSQRDRIEHISEQGLKITQSQGEANAWLQEMVECSS
ncbi:UDP-2,4-diacetamido-2,4,6-trideoxy-beta-L-altropyranose hydrolase [Paenibacillus sp. strain BS8-2]